MARFVTITDNQLLDAWLCDKAPNTARLYRRVVEGFLAGVGKPLVKLRLADVEAYIRTIRTSAERTHRVNHSAIKSFLRFAYENKAAKRLYIDMSPAGPSIEPDYPRLTARNVRDLMAAARTPRDQAILHLGLDLGVSAEEMTKLRYNDVRPLQKLIYISGPAARMIDLPATTLTALMTVRSTKKGNEPLLRSFRRDNAMSAETIRYVVARLGQAAGIDVLNPRTLRNTMIHTSLADGKTLRDVQRLLGMKTAKRLGMFVARHA